MASVSLTIRIDENDKKTIEQFAKKDDRSINYVVNQAIKEFIQKTSPNKKEQSFTPFRQAAAYKYSLLPEI